MCFAFEFTVCVVPTVVAHYRNGPKSPTKASLDGYSSVALWIGALLSWLGVCGVFSWCVTIGFYCTVQGCPDWWYHSWVLCFGLGERLLLPLHFELVHYSIDWVFVAGVYSWCAHIGFDCTVQGSPDWWYHSCIG